VPTIPTTPKGQDTRGRILAAARRVFARDGYVDARMVDIAKTTGLSTGGLYRYFVDKTDVFAAVIGDIHEELYEASGHTEHSFRDNPLAALTDANRGYVQHYYENRDVMRAFNEASGVDQRFRSIWWEMRDRHVDRFVKTFVGADREPPVKDLDIRAAAEAMACMVEQCCYVWFAHEDMTAPGNPHVSVDQATDIVSRVWHQTFFGAS
jgi:AcrR family transcriptional regulator